MNATNIDGTNIIAKMPIVKMIRNAPRGERAPRNNRRRFDLEREHHQFVQGRDAWALRHDLAVVSVARKKTSSSEATAASPCRPAYFDRASSSDP